jgi:branched-chain amino acid transport system permease protein
MLKHLFSDDLPRSRWLALFLCALLVVLVCAPLVSTSARALNTTATIAIFFILVASFDLLLGYCGIVSFAHAMFFGIGSYGVAIALHRLGPSWRSLAEGTAAALAISAILSLLIALASLRVKAIFFTMSTLAFATAFAALVQRLSWLTGGDDGLNFRLPEPLGSSDVFFTVPILGLDVTGRQLVYYFVVFSAVMALLLMLRVVNSRFGRVLEAVRENELRAEAIGYRTLDFRLAANCIAAVAAAWAGVLMALWTRYVGPSTSADFNVMLNILLMAVVGGLGTIYGAAVGVTVFVIAQNYLQLSLGAVDNVVQRAGADWLARLFHPDRWLLWFGVVFILCVYFFPSGVVGYLRLRQIRQLR